MEFANAVVVTNKLRSAFQIIRRRRDVVVVVDAVPLREPRELPLHHEDRGVAGQPSSAQVSQSKLSNGEAVTLQVQGKRQRRGQ